MRGTRLSLKSGKWPLFIGCSRFLCHSVISLVFVLPELCTVPIDTPSPFCHICYEYISVVHWYMAIFYLRGAQYCSLEVWVATVSSQTKGQLWLDTILQVYHKSACWDGNRSRSSFLLACGVWLFLSLQGVGQNLPLKLPEGQNLPLHVVERPAVAASGCETFWHDRRPLKARYWL